MHYDLGSKWEIKLSTVYYEAWQYCPYAVQVNLTGWIIIQQTKLWYSNFMHSSVCFPGLDYEKCIKF